MRRNIGKKCMAWSALILALALLLSLFASLHAAGHVCTGGEDCLLCEWAQEARQYLCPLAEICFAAAVLCAAGIFLPALNGENACSTPVSLKVKMNN